MNVVPAIGSTCFGIVIGWLVRFFIFRFRTFTPNVLSSVISLMCGAATMRFLSADPNVLWFYPIGLLIGFIAYTVGGVLAIKSEATAPIPASPSQKTETDGTPSGGGGGGRYSKP